jgi:hypothetical protein
MHVRPIDVHYRAAKAFNLWFSGGSCSVTAKILGGVAAGICASRATSLAKGCFRFSAVSSPST